MGALAEDQDSGLGGGGAGTDIGLLLAFGLEYLQSDVLRSTDDVERHVGVTVLGSIPTISGGEDAPGQQTRTRRLALPWAR